MKNNIRIVRNEPDPQIPTPPDFDKALIKAKKAGLNTWKLKIGLGAVITGLIITGLLLFNRNNKNEQNELAKKSADTSVSSVKPPLKGMDVPYDTFEINVAAGDTVVYKGCTNIIFKPGSVAGMDGATVQKTKVVCREFQNQTDVMLSGIPMMYDSAGQKYLFESGGMFELKSVNKEEKIAGAGMVEVKMCTSLPQDKFNWYSLDEKTGRWDYIKPVAPEARHLQADTALPANRKTEGTQPAEDIEEITVVSQNAIIKEKPLLPPKRKNPSAPTFSIDVNHIPELQVYTNVEFEVMPGQGYDAANLSEVMDYIRVKPTPEDGIYMVEFYDRGRKYNYKARPVFDNEKDYQQALREFRKKEEEQKKAIAKKAVEEKRNAEIQERRFQEELRRRNNAQKSTGQGEQFNYGGMVAALSIDQFGYYNSDRPISNNNLATTITYQVPEESFQQGQLYQYYLNRNAVMVNYSFEPAGSRGKTTLSYRSDEQYVLMAFAEKDQKIMVTIFTPAEFVQQIKGKANAEIRMTRIDKKFSTPEEVHQWLKKTFAVTPASFQKQ
jgi:hypothetical protein